MTYKEAIKVVKENSHIIGKKVRDVQIDDVIIYPRDEQSYDSFINNYIRTFDWEKSLIPFLGSDMGIRCILDRHRINNGSVILYIELDSALKQLEEKD